MLNAPDDGPEGIAKTAADDPQCAQTAEVEWVDVERPMILLSFDRAPGLGGLGPLASFNLIR